MTMVMVVLVVFEIAWRIKNNVSNLVFRCCRNTYCWSIRRRHHPTSCGGRGGGCLMTLPVPHQGSLIFLTPQVTDEDCEVFVVHVLGGGAR